MKLVEGKDTKVAKYFWDVNEPQSGTHTMNDNLINLQLDGRHLKDSKGAQMQVKVRKK